MPFAEEFDAAAIQLDAAAEEVAALTPPVRGSLGPQVIIGGTLAEAMELVVSRCEQVSDRASAALRDLAVECRQRAEVCRQAEAAFAGFQAAQATFQEDERQFRERQDRFESDPATFPAPGTPPTAPGAPPAPPPWVEF